MASLQVISGQYHICFRFNGHRYKRSLKTTRPDQADSRRVRLEETIRLVETGRLDIPDDVGDIARFLLADGKAAKRKSGLNGHATPPPQSLLGQVFDKFFATIPAGNLEESTLKGMHRHEGHLLRLLGSKYQFRDLSVDKLQSYVNKRANEKTHYGSLVSAATIHKELVTLGTVWRWAERLQLVHGSFPRRGIRLPKQDELPPFQTWDEITQGLMRGLATGQLRPDAGNILLHPPAANEKRGVAESDIETATIVQPASKASSPQPKKATNTGGASKGQSRKRATSSVKKPTSASAEKPKWYEMPTIRRYLPRK